MSDKHSEKNIRNKTLMAVLLAVAAVILLILILVGVYVAVLMDQVDYQPGNNPGMETLSSSQLEELLNENLGSVDPSVEVINPDDIIWETVPASELVNKDVITILLIGQDRRPGEKIARSDSMILCVLNKKTGILTMASLMRDMYLPIPGYLKANRINACYVFGGMPLLKECIKQNFGVVVDGCVEVDFDGFEEVIELLGGVDMELSAAEADHLNTNEAYYDCPDEEWNLKEGMNHLTSTQALAYARVRNVGAGDFGRTERQRKVLTALFQKAKSMSLVEANDLLMTTAGLVTTDLSRSDILGYAMTVLPILVDLKLESMRIPYDNSYRSEYVEGIGYVLVPNLERNRAFLAELYE